MNLIIIPPVVIIICHVSIIIILVKQFGTQSTACKFDTLSELQNWKFEAVKLYLPREHGGGGE